MKHNLMTLLCALETQRQRRITPRDLFDGAQFIHSDPVIAYASWTNRNGLMTEGQRWTWDENNYYITLENNLIDGQIVATIEYASEVTEE